MSTPPAQTQTTPIEDYLAMVLLRMNKKVSNNNVYVQLEEVQPNSKANLCRSKLQVSAFQPQPVLSLFKIFFKMGNRT